MSKKILILEPSSTTQAIIASKLKKTEYEPVFEGNGVKFLVNMYNNLPATVLINAKAINPKSSEMFVSSSCCFFVCTKLNAATDNTMTAFFHFIV